MSDLIDRQAAIDYCYALINAENPSDPSDEWNYSQERINQTEVILHHLEFMPSAHPEQNNASEFWRKRAEFYSDMCMNLIGEMGKGVKVESVKISENGIEFIKEQPTAQPEIIYCKDCKHFHYDMPYLIQGVPILGHEVCDFWGDGCKTSENGFCSYAERRQE